MFVAAADLRVSHSSFWKTWSNTALLRVSLYMVKDSTVVLGDGCVFPCDPNAEIILVCIVARYVPCCTQITERSRLKAYQHLGVKKGSMTSIRLVTKSMLAIKAHGNARSLHNT
jgi:hypothetical protein